MDWTASQWAEAVCYARRFIGNDVPRTLDGARRVRHAWLSNRLDEPGELVIVEVEREMDFMWAFVMMESVVLELDRAGLIRSK